MGYQCLMIHKYQPLIRIHYQLPRMLRRTSEWLMLVKASKDMVLTFGQLEDHPSHVRHVPTFQEPAQKEACKRLAQEFYQLLY